ncbi:MAG: hypothetical protein JWO42_2265, partial [Chloroflexi bacterium]|nr:hypothetical protein [Chloroflexota bacterium]
MPSMPGSGHGVTTATRHNILILQNEAGALESNRLICISKRLRKPGALAHLHN